MKIEKLSAIVVASAVGLTMTACGGDPTKDSTKSASDTITVGSAAFPENEIVAEIYAQALAAKGVKVKKKLNIGAREAYIPAIKGGEIDLLPEYTGNLLTYFDKAATATDDEDVEKALDAKVPAGLEVLEASKAEDKDSLNVTAAFAKKNNLETIADLKGVSGLSLAANPEFKERTYGIPGLEKVYGITGIKFVPISDGGGPATLKALLDDKVQVADIYSTTPSILENKLVTLKDPKYLIAAQNVVPLINKKKASAKVTGILNKVSGLLTTADLLDLNSKNQGKDKVAPAELAKQWLQDKGLL
ncbi:MAG: ABC transporter substrate-binding protein [Aeromicrobium sp.]